MTQSEHILFVLMVCAYMFVCGCDIPSLFTGRWRIFRFAMYASVTISIIKIAENAVETLFTANFNQLQDIDHLGGWIMFLCLLIGLAVGMIEHLWKGAPHPNGT